jgi:spermidine synthase
MHDAGRMVRLSALLLTVLTGFTALVYEIAWQRWLATLLGSDSEATSLVLGIFLGGLALGYQRFGALSRRRVATASAAARPARLLALYGAIEAAIGIYALFFPILFNVLRTLSTALPQAPAGVGFALDALVAAAAIGPPAVLMGATIPLLTQALSRGPEDATRIHALVYGSNTLGAFAGALAAGYWLVPALGLVGVLRAMAVLNLVAGGAFLVLDRCGPPPGTAAARDPQSALPGSLDRSPRNSSGEVSDLGSLAWVALLCGFATMTLQTVAIRIGGLSFGGSHLTFAQVVSVFVLCIAAGSFAVSALKRTPPRLLVGVLWAWLVVMIVLYGLLQDAPYWAHVLRVRFGSTPADFEAFQRASFVAVLGVIGLPALLSGATLPLLFHQQKRGGESLGDVAGRLYGWNTAGSLLGAILGGYALLFFLDLHSVYRVGVTAVALAAVMVTTQVLDLRGPGAIALLLAPVLAAVALLVPWSPERLSAGLFRVRSAGEHSLGGPNAYFESRQGIALRFYQDGPNASIAVKEFESPGGTLSRSLLTNGKSDGSVPGEYPTMGLVSLIPALLAERAERAFVVGYGTGVSAGELAALDDMQEVVVAEIAGGVLDAAPLFDRWSRGVLAQPGVRVVRSDAYRALSRTGGHFDVIVSEPSNTWIPGIEALYSREFLEAARDRLSPGGVYAQWFHAYEADSETLALVLRTFSAAFPHVSVWYGMGSDLILLGIKNPGPALDTARLVRRALRPDFRAGLARCSVASPAALFAHELLPIGVVHALENPGPEHSLLHPRLAHLAVRALFRGDFAEPPASSALEIARLGNENSLQRRLAALPTHTWDEATRADIVEETCAHRPKQCVALLAEWSHAVPRSVERDRIVAQIERIPILDDVSLDRIPALADLYDDAPLAGGRDPLGEARQATQDFERFYHHAVPFRRAALAARWRACEEASVSREDCAAERAAAEKRLGDLDEALVSNRHLR